ETATSTNRLSLHDALPISASVRSVTHARIGRWVIDRRDPRRGREEERHGNSAQSVSELPRHDPRGDAVVPGGVWWRPDHLDLRRDRKSTRLNSSHVAISYA